MLIHTRTSLVLQHLVDPMLQAPAPDRVAAMLSRRSRARPFGPVSPGVHLHRFGLGELTVWISHDPHLTLASVALGEGPRKHTVLVVDDDPMPASCTETSSSRGDSWSWKPATAKRLSRSSGTHRVDLAIVDVIMPVTNCVDWVRAIRANSSRDTLPILVQTSDPDAVRVPVWGPLHVAHVMDKLALGEWFEQQVHDAPAWRAPSPGG